MNAPSPPPTDAGSPSGHSRLEIYSAVVLGLATVAIAWAAYQASLWGGIQDARLTESVLRSNQAVDAAQRADTIVTFDQTLFVEFGVVFEQYLPETVEEFEAFVADGIGGFILGNMSEPGAGAVFNWFENDLDYPFDAVYAGTLYADADTKDAESTALFEAAGEANESGDGYVLASTWLAAVLFLAGISTVFRSERTRMWLLGGSSVVLAGSAIYLVTLPNAVGV